LALSLSRPSALLALVLRPDPLIGEYYMHGELVLTEGSFTDFIAFLFQNTQSWRHSVTGAIYCQFWECVGWFASLNPIGRSRRNVTHHYDLTDQLFDLFLDENRQYSCAYFRGTADTLDIAQKQKIARLTAKLHLQANRRVLDIGCGWGGLATALSKCADNLNITGITLSENQYAFLKKIN
jgi:cyclopropane-fatty-acyl-phospholipid synthase